MKTLLLILFTTISYGQYFHVSGGATAAPGHTDNLFYQAGVGYQKKLGAQAAYRATEKIGRIENIDLQATYSPLEEVTFLAGATLLIPKYGENSIQPIYGIQGNIRLTETGYLTPVVQMTNNGTDPMLIAGLGLKLKMIFSKKKHKRFF